MVFSPSLSLSWILICFLDFSIALCLSVSLSLSPSLPGFPGQSDAFHSPTQVTFMAPSVVTALTSKFSLKWLLVASWEPHFRHARLGGKCTEKLKHLTQKKNKLLSELSQCEETHCLGTELSMNLPK